MRGWLLGGWRAESAKRDSEGTDDTGRAACPQARGRKKEVGVLGSLEARMRGTEEPEPGCLRRGRRRLSGKAEAAPAAKRPNRAGCNVQGTISQVTNSSVASLCGLIHLLRFLLQ